MAITKKQKKAIVAQYGEWLQKSEALVLTEYTGLNMKQMDALRSKIREAGGEFHVVKNTLLKMAFQNADLSFDEAHFAESTAVAFAFDDPPGIAKAMTDFAKESDAVKIKAGYLEGRMMTAEEVKALADLPPLPVMRATLLGTLLAPASQLVRTLAEPGRQVAAVIKAFADKDAAPEAA